LKFAKEKPDRTLGYPYGVASLNAHECVACKDSGCTLCISPPIERGTLGGEKVAFLKGALWHHNFPCFSTAGKVAWHFVNKSRCLGKFRNNQSKEDMPQFQHSMFMPTRCDAWKRILLNVWFQHQHLVCTLAFPHGRQLLSVEEQLI